MNPQALILLFAVSLPFAGMFMGQKKAENNEALCNDARLNMAQADADMYWFLHLRNFDRLSPERRDTAVVIYTQAKHNYAVSRDYLKQNCE